ncbi:unnamed protein product (macronuclear) [Paramecium tetraurelia]|uniref:Peptidase M14 domain-containing protein n=1 Tax=Paramecium tetraurelia TaxID=5888 RepID=A0DH06_PARTE|nr:uncharacterized protein GSPATT00002452001 [Paramecium tetraurelia]CAK82323.1 unnamed protein product [Paramecium tetraurelia]|eukprot:XP_001449720.1 hypothetical protein (macronuclear) [Paramecium tetraurelia strain d4-2]
MNKKLQLITTHNYSLINYLKVFQKKLQLLDTTIQPQSNQQNGQLTFITSSIQIYSLYDSSNLFYLTEDNDTINILLNSDSNTNGCTQWFHFQVQALKPTVTIKFKILNNRRRQQLLTNFKPYTSKSTCFDLHYYKTNIHHPYYANDDAQIAKYQQLMHFYTLEFKFTFQNDEIVTFAYAQPYPLSRALSLTDYKTVGYTQLNNPIIQIKRGKAKQYVVILARQHPSETSGSFVVEQLINIINSSKYRYIIYPMVNPDGVFLGNSRCNLHGVDLNRKWINPQLSSEPEIYYIKSSLEKYKQKITMMVDLHGHSTKQHYFIYGCANNQNNNNEIKNFIAKFQNHSLFHMKHCSLETQANRKSTARQTFWYQYKVQFSITIEISLFGSLNGRFSDSDYKEIAQQIYDSIEKCNEPIADQTTLPVIDCLGNDQDESDSECEQDFVFEVAQKRDSYKEPKKFLFKQKTIQTETQCVQQEQQLKKLLLPQIKKIKSMTKSEHKSSTKMEFENQLKVKQDSFQKNFNIINYFPQRNTQPKRMSSIKKDLNLNKCPQIKVDQMKNY